MTNEKTISNDQLNITTGEWFENWLENYIKPVAKPAGYEHYADNCRKHIIPKLGDIKLTDVTTSVLQKFLNTESTCGNLRDGGPLSAKSIKNMRVVLDVAMKQAVAEGKIPANPVPLTAIKHVKSKRVEDMTDKEQSMLEELLFGRSDNYSNAELMAMYTGARRGEICAMRWGNYNAAKGTVHIEETVKRLTNRGAKPDEPKTKLVFCSVKTDSSDRVLKLPPFLQDIIEQQRAMFVTQFGCFPTADDFIFFSAQGTVLDPDNLSHYHDKLLKELGLEHKKFHALRHTFATRGIENGIDVSTMSGLLGHAEVTTTTHYYVHPRDAAMENAMMGICPVSKSPAVRPSRTSA